MDLVPSETRIYSSGHGAEILADDVGLVPVRFQAQYGVEFFRGIAHIDSVRGSEAAGNPVQAMKSHHMINA